jgi:hypothetical protein
MRTILQAREPGQGFAQANRAAAMRHRNARNLQINPLREGLRETVHKFSNFRGFCLYRSGSVCYVAKAGKNLIELR